MSKPPIANANARGCRARPAPAPRALITAFCAHLTMGLLAVAPVRAQTAEITGSWTLEYARSTRTEADGTLTVLEWGEATLDLRREPDGSLIGTWRHMTAAGDTVRAIYRGDGSPETFRLELDWEASGHAPGARIRSQHMEGRLTDDGRLAGSMWVLGTVARSGVRMPWRGRRSGDP